MKNNDILQKMREEASAISSKYEYTFETTESLQKYIQEVRKFLNSYGFEDGEYEISFDETYGNMNVKFTRMGELRMERLMNGKNPC